MTTVAATLQPLTLLGKLTNLKSALTGSRVTELLIKLLEIVAYDACDAKRNLHSWYWSVSAFRDSIDAINELVATAGKGSSWVAYKRYTTMIPELEKYMIQWISISHRLNACRFLLDFCALSQVESLKAHLPSANAVSTDLIFIKEWKEGREKLRSQARQLLDWSHFPVLCPFVGITASADCGSISGRESERQESV
jgi:hypothetical protein